jgi:membrane-associated phospholipid phosphatase
MRGVTAGPQRRLLSRRLRPALGCLVVAGIALITVLGFGVAGTSTPATPGRFDRAVDGWLIAHFDHDVGLVHALADFGNAVPMIVTVLVLAGALRWLGRPLGALLAVGAPAVAIAVTEWILKPVSRAHGSGPSFPSGHATVFCAVVFVVIVVVVDQSPPRLTRSIQAVVVLAAAGLAGCVMAALVAAQYHYATDVLGGACVALVVVLGLAFMIDWCADSRMRSPD